ncbi:MAG: twin-arginine translocation pathway signal protein, partial [Hoeflea sp.]
MQRRQFLSILGGGVVLAAGAGAGFAMTRTPSKALEPWSLAGTSPYSEPRKRALSYAILAPNPHNRQPWQVELRGQDTVVLTVDLDRLLPHTDPFSRQITVGLGCFLELMTMAAAETGHRVDLDLFPQGTDPQRLTTAPVAMARFVSDPSIRPDPLFAHVMARRSNKEPFDTARAVTDESFAAVLDSARHGGRLGGTNDPVEVASWRRLTEEALQIEIDTPRTYKESVDLFRIGKAEINANPDGIDFSGPMFESLALIGQFSREVALDRNSMGFKQGEAAVIENTRTAMAHVWMV